MSDQTKNQPNIPGIPMRKKVGDIKLKKVPNTRPQISSLVRSQHPIHKPSEVINQNTKRLPKISRSSFVRLIFAIRSKIFVFDFNIKNIGIILGAVLATFGVSLASSQVLARLGQSNSSVQANEIAAIAPSSLPVTSDPDTLALSPVVITDPTAIYLPIEKIDVPDPLSQRKAFLKTYLQSKGSLLADHVDALSEQTQWKLIIAISNAESSYCKHKALNNCWGIGGAWNLKAYDNYDQAISDVNRILEQHYISAGLDSPKKIENKWVGHKNDNWEAAANHVMDDLKNIQ